MIPPAYQSYKGIPIIPQPQHTPIHPSIPFILHAKYLSTPLDPQHQQCFQLSTLIIPYSNHNNLPIEVKVYLTASMD